MRLLLEGILSNHTIIIEGETTRVTLLEIIETGILIIILIRTSFKITPHEIMLEEDFTDNRIIPDFRITNGKDNPHNQIEECHKLGEERIVITVLTEYLRETKNLRMLC